MNLTLTGCYPISGNKELNEMCIWDSVQECEITNSAAEERLKSDEQHLDLRSQWYKFKPWYS